MYLATIQDVSGFGARARSPGPDLYVLERLLQKHLRPLIVAIG